MKTSLRYVISPEAFKKIGPATGQAHSVSESDEVFKELCFGYHYDNLGRQTESHVPGGGWKYAVFDKRDFPVLTADEQDQANGYWKFNKYDALNRVVQTGLIFGIGGYSRSQLQNDFDNFTGLNFEERGTDLKGYTNRSFPFDYTPVEANLRSVTYYDDYAWQTESAYNFQSANAYHAQQLNVRGLVTGSLSRNLETNAWYKSVNYFDYQGRVIQSFNQNHLGGIDRSEYNYRFNGEVLKMRMVHQGITEVYEYAYDHVGRKSSFTHNNKVVAKYEYDGIGRLQTKKLQPAGSAITSNQSGNWTDVNTWLSGILPTLSDNVTINTGHTITIPTGVNVGAGSLTDKGILQNYGTLNLGNLNPSVGSSDLYAQTFKYHIRGGLKGINLDNAGNLTNSLFSFKLGYEDTGFFDGNIGKQEWKSSLDNVTRSYTYDYDGASRIKSGVYTGGGTEDYSLENMSYDENGSIKTLWRKGMTQNNTFGYIDKLGYIYADNSNKINSVTDAVSGNLDTGDFRDGNTSGNDYDYWVDGSLKKDLNKGITSIQYNYLKLPKKVTFLNGNTLDNQYDANGKKLRSVSSDGITYDFVGNTIYKNNVLYQIDFGEGRIVNGFYEYFITDHLGNLRVSFKDSLGIAKITQKQDYDPWGVENWTSKYVNNSKISNFKYNLKETQLETGYIDLGNRMVNPSIGRMLSIDRFSENYSDISPFQFTDNNPIRNIDINGDSLSVSNDILNDKILYQAFLAFASTKTGYGFLSQYAKKGQKFGDISFSSNGEFHNKKINLNYTAKNENREADGTTSHTSDLEKRYMSPEFINIDININKDGASQYYQKKDLFGLTNVFFHESFIHGDLNTSDYLDDGLFNNSNLPKNAYIDSASQTHKQHAAVSQGYVNFGAKTPFKFGGARVFRGYQDASQILNKNYSDGFILKTMWYFSGGLQIGNNGQIIR